MTPVNKGNLGMPTFEHSQASKRLIDEAFPTVSFSMAEEVGFRSLGPLYSFLDMTSLAVKWAFVKE
jgi:hypothetical protein